MEDVLESAINVVAKLNYVSEREIGCALFRIEYVPNSTVSICTSEFVIWTTEEDRSDQCDYSEQSILSYVKLRLGQIQEEMGRLISSYPSLFSGEAS